MKITMTKNDLIKKIENGRDILFDVNGRHYGIFTWCKQGIGIGEATQDTSKDPLTYYPTAHEVISGYKIGNVPLSDLCDKIIITDYS